MTEEEHLRSEVESLKRDREEYLSQPCICQWQHRAEAAEARLQQMTKALEEEQEEHRKLKEDVDALIEEARQEERDDGATLWPEWADKLLKILRGFGVPCDDEEGVDLPAELREWLEVYEQDVRRAALSTQGSDT